MTAFHPHPYQEYAIQRIIKQPSTGLFLDMGLGKTVITLTAISDLMFDPFEHLKVLVIAPKKVAEATWQTEAAKWDHLRWMTFSTVMGTEARRRAALKVRADVYVINRENVWWLVDELGAGWDFDTVIVDESSSFKNPASKRFKALKRVLPRIRRMVILTGTPAPNGIEDLWAQIYLLDRGERLGRFISHYRERYFDYNPWRHEHVPKKGAFEAVQAKIADICVSMSAEDWLQLPERVVHDVPVTLDGEAREVYRRLERDMLLEVDGEEITAMSAAALTGKLLQLCGGAVYDGQGGTHVVHTAKLEALSELLEGLNGEHALLFYGYRHELPGLERVLTASGLRCRLLESSADAGAWNRGEVDVLLAHPASCAYGLNLQAGGRHIVWYTLSWSLELYQQANARLYRQGQEKPVIIHRLLVQGGVDEDVARALEGKADTQEALLTALKARIREARK